MKKCEIWLCLLFVMFVLTGCSKAKPDTVVDTFCKAMQDFDMDKMAECVASDNSSVAESVEEDSELSDSLLEYYKENANKMKYSIESSKADGESGSVTVKFKYVDTSPVITAALGEYVQQGIALAFSGADMSDEATETLFTDIFNEKKESTDTKMIEETVTFSCVKDDKGWLIKEVADEVTNVLMSNAVNAFKSISDSFNETEDETSNETDINVEENEDVSIDVPMNQEIALATINIKVTGCEETKELTSEYSSTTAQNGTKFVIFTVEVENITKDTFNFDASDIPLVDSQDRSYNLYSDAFMYAADSICYTDLAPNIRQMGTMIYNVPEDATDYCMKVGKSGTNEVYVLWAK